MSRRTVAFHFSGGKDSTLGLHVLLARDDVEVVRLVTTTHPQRGASTVHGIPLDLMHAQARSIGIPLQEIPMPGPGLDGYTEIMSAAAIELGRDGIDAFAFGDLSCSGMRAHKEEQFRPLGIDVVEPLGELTSRQCVDAFLRSGIRAVTVIVDAAVLGRDDVGMPVDRRFVDRLPPGADPCGEFGEYHSFTYDGPIFDSPIEFTLSAPQRITREIQTTEGPRSYSYWLATPRATAQANPSPTTGGP